MSYNFSSTYKTVPLSQIYKSLDVKLIELFVNKTTDYSEFLKSDFLDLIENSKMTQDMETKFLSKYVYYFLKSHKILLDYMKFASHEFADIITVPMIPILDQYKLVYSIDKSIRSIHKKCFQNIINYDNIGNVKKYNKYMNKMYDNVLYCFNTIIHTDLLSEPTICHYKYYSSNCNDNVDNIIINKKKTIII